MKKLSDEIIHLFQSQGFVVVSTIDKNGSIHNSCKGLIKIEQQGRVYLLDLYRVNTYKNLKQNPNISITVVDEHRFKGYCLKGKSRLLQEGEFNLQFIKAWEDKIASRITQRLLKNMRDEKGHSRHPEALLPKPEYMIEMDVEEVVDLTPHHLK